MKQLRLTGCVWPNPHDEDAHEAMHTARYNLAALTQVQAYDILSYAEAYLHLATHPAGTESCVKTLREVRRLARPVGERR